MQDQVEAHAGLNGGGAGHDFVPMLDAETMPVHPPDASTAGTPLPRRWGRRSAIWAILADPNQCEALRRRVSETGESLNDIAKDIGVSPGILSEHVKRLCWPRPADAPRAPRRPAGESLSGMSNETSSARARLLGAVELQINLVEKRLKGRKAQVEEKDSRILGNLAKTLSALMQMGECGTTSKDAEPQNSDDLEADLARRITRWARGE